MRDVLVVMTPDRRLRFRQQGLVQRALVVVDEVI